MYKNAIRKLVFIIFDHGWKAYFFFYIYSIVLADSDVQINRCSYRRICGFSFLLDAVERLHCELTLVEHLKTQKSICLSYIIKSNKCK